MVRLVHRLAMARGETEDQAEKTKGDKSRRNASLQRNHLPDQQYPTQEGQYSPSKCPKAIDLMAEAPTTVSEQQLKELHIRVALKS